LKQFEDAWACKERLDAELLPLLRAHVCFVFVVCGCVGVIGRKKGGGRVHVCVCAVCCARVGVCVRVCASVRVSVGAGGCVFVGARVCE